MNKSVVVFGIVAACVVAGTATAQTYHVTYSVGASMADEILTTSANADTSGLYTVTKLTGTFDGAAISLLAPGTYPLGANPNDNLFKPSASYFDYNGLSFTTGTSSYNLYLDGDVRQCTINCAASGVSVSNFAVTAIPAAAAVPEPGTWTMIIVGFGAIGFVMRSARRRFESGVIGTAARITSGALA